MKQRPKVQLPCSSWPSNEKPNKTNKGQHAIFLNSAIWGPNQTGTILITFGSAVCSGCSPNAAWTIIGSESNNPIPCTNCNGGYLTANWGFIDPPFSDFTFNGITYPVSLFQCETRNNCNDLSQNCSPNTGCLPNSSDPTCYGCPSNYVAGSTIIHESSHGIGSMLHEHQNNLNGSNKINLNDCAVINYYNSIGSNETTADNNAITQYSGTAYSGSNFDPDSIMLYKIPDNWLLGYQSTTTPDPILNGCPTPDPAQIQAFNNPTKANFTLSATDKQWLSKIYPVNTNMPKLTIKFVDLEIPDWKMAWVQYVIQNAYYNDPDINNGQGIGIIITFTGTWANGSVYNNVFQPKVSTNITKGSTNIATISTNIATMAANIPATISAIFTGSPTSTSTPIPIPISIPTSTLTKILPPFCSNSGSVVENFQNIPNNFYIYLIILLLLLIFFIRLKS